MILAAGLPGAIKAEVRAEEALAGPIDPRVVRVAPKEPAESLATFTVAPGFRVEQVAAEPLVCDPVDLAFDEYGRLYVCEMRGFPLRKDDRLCRIRLLEDTDHDGRFDKSTIFADKLAFPTSILCYDGGVFVGAAPQMLYFKDTDGDGVADVSRPAVTGFTVIYSTYPLNSLRWGLDCRIHGINHSGGKLRPVMWQREGRAAEEFVLPTRHNFSFDPKSGKLFLESGGGQFGLGIDAWGRQFTCTNRNHMIMLMYERRYIARNPKLIAPAPAVSIADDGPAARVFRTSPVEGWRALRMERRVAMKLPGHEESDGRPSGTFTASSGVTVYTGDVYPAEFHGMVVVGDTTGNLIHRKRFEPDGASLKAFRIDDRSEFVSSSEIWCRPVQYTNSPAGVLYFTDMYREICEYITSIPEEAQAVIDLNSGWDRGRIYRIVPDGFTQPNEPVRLGDLSTTELVALLKHPNGWHRQTAGRLLYERQDPRASAMLTESALQSASPLGRLHAMYLLDAFGALDAPAVLARLDDDQARIREHAVRLSEKLLAASSALRRKLYRMTDDPDVRVCYQLAFTLGELPDDDEGTAALARIAARHGTDPWIRLAVLSSSLGRAGEIFFEMTADTQWRGTESGRSVLEQIAKQVGLQGDEDQVAKVLGRLDEFDEGEKELAVAVVRGLDQGLATARSSLRGRLTDTDTRAGRVLRGMIDEAANVATDVDRTEVLRLEAIHTLGFAPPEDTFRALGELLDGRQPQTIQMAALKALGRHRRREVGEMIVAAWAGFSPQVQKAAAEVLFGRLDRLALLLDAVEGGTISPAQLDPARIERLLAHPSDDVRTRANDLLGGLKLARREEVVAAYRQALSLDADPRSGKAVFKRVCSTCHRLEGVGYDLGLPLMNIHTRGTEGILLHLLDPNREVTPEYFNYVVVTVDGLTVTGMIGDETANSITLARAEGESDTVLRTDVDEMLNTGLSIMPEGLEEQITKQEMADLIGYLMSAG